MICRLEDRKIFQALLQSARRNKYAALPLSDLVLFVGKCFLDVSYEARTLEREGPEDLVINLRQMDCFTFVEYVAALARVIKAGESRFSYFGSQLTQLRYRGGIIAGYASRLHYFSEWLYDNERKGIIRNMTKDLRGQPYRKILNFMTHHRDRYGALSRAEDYRQMRTVEKRLARRSLHYLPQGQWRHFENEIAEADIIGLTTDIEGLDVVHVGLALRVKGRIHLLHASETGRQVVISRETLCRYLARRKTVTGIMVGRLL